MERSALGRPHRVLLNYSLLFFISEEGGLQLCSGAHLME